MKIKPEIYKRDKRLYHAIEEGAYHWVKMMIDNGEINLEKKGVVGFSGLRELRDSVLFFIEEAYKRGRD